MIRGNLNSSSLLLKFKDIKQVIMSKELTPEQKVERAVYQKQYWQDNKVKLTAQKAQYRQDNKDEIDAWNRQYRQDHKPEMAAYQKQYRQDNKVDLAIYKKQYQQDHKTEEAARARMRYLDDVDYRLKVVTENGIKRSIKGTKLYKHSIDLLGCSIPEVREYLERQFQPGMAWENWSAKGWHIDHIIPLSSFDFTDYEQQKRAWHYTNLRPLWAEENMGKHNKIIEIQLVLL